MWKIHQFLSSIRKDARKRKLIPYFCLTEDTFSKLQIRAISTTWKSKACFCAARHVCNITGKNVMCSTVHIINNSNTPSTPIGLRYRPTLCRVAQKVEHFSTHHIFGTAQDKMKRISPKCFLEFLAIKIR